MSQVVVSTANSSASRQLAQGAQLSIPINHFEGNFTCSHDTLEQLQQEDRIVFRYLNNPNGSIDDIAGITNETRNVVGMMPHPERACDPMLGSSDGIQVLASLLEAAQ
jgi:phosphoribosylformylglycinamidine synthase